MTNSSDILKDQQIAEMAVRLERMEKLMSRRFDEVSAEIHATCEMLDMAEAGIGARFGEILCVLSAITFHGDGGSPHNVGVELDAVVKTTEDAANKILDRAEAISGMMTAESLIDWTDVAARQAFFDKVKHHTEDILTACAFQDLTGQRIGKTLENIRKAEADLTETLKKMGLNVDFAVKNKVTAHETDTHTVANQGYIDALFG